MNNKAKNIFTAIGIIICYLLLDIIGILPLIILNVNTDEAEEMLQALIRGGAVEPFPIDGINHCVIH